MTLLGIRWRFYRPAEPQRGWDAAALLMAIYAFAVFSGVMWSRSVENSTAFWTANGVLAAGLLLLRPKVGALFAAACIAVNAGLNIVAHLPRKAKLDGTGKPVVKSFAKERLPSSIVYAPKLGFSVAESAWLPAAPLLQNSMIAELFKWDRAYLQVLTQRVTEVPRCLYSLLSVEMWARIFLRGDRPEAAAT